MSTFEVCSEDVERYNQNFAATILQEYYGYYLYLCRLSTVDTVTGCHAALQVLIHLMLILLVGKKRSMTLLVLADVLLMK